LIKNNGAALNGIHSADKAIDFATDNSLIKGFQNHQKILFNKNNKEFIIDLFSNVGYEITTTTKNFKYASDSNTIIDKLLDRASNRTIIFDIQNVGDYLLFVEDKKITCFNVKTELPCKKNIDISMNKDTNINKQGEIAILFDQLFFYENKERNEIIKCQSGVGFNPEKKEISYCGDKRYIKLKDLD